MVFGFSGVAVQFSNKDCPFFPPAYLFIYFKNIIEQVLFFMEKKDNLWKFKMSRAAFGIQKAKRS